MMMYAPINCLNIKLTYQSALHVGSDEGIYGQNVSHQLKKPSINWKKFHGIIEAYIIVGVLDSN